MADIIFIYHEDSSSQSVYIGLYTYIHMTFIERFGREQIKSAGWLWTALGVSIVYRKEQCGRHNKHIINLQNNEYVTSPQWSLSVFTTVRDLSRLALQLCIVRNSVCSVR